MILLLKYYTKKANVNTSTIIIYLLFLICIACFKYSVTLFIIIVDMYLFIILSEFNFKKNINKKKSEIKMEIVAEGSRKAETDNLANILIDYNDKFIK